MEESPSAKKLLEDYSTLRRDHDKLKEDYDYLQIAFDNLLNTLNENLSSIDWPVLGIFAELDKGIPVETVNEFESALNEVGVENQIYIYDGVDHAFANPSGERYAPEESKDAWSQTISFLELNLK